MPNENAVTDALVTPATPVASKMSRSAMLQATSGQPSAPAPVGNNRLGSLTARLRGGPMPGKTAPNPEAQDDSRDSFGQAISQQDLALQPDNTPLPQFQNGVLTAVGVPTPEPAALPPQEITDTSESTPPAPKEKSTPALVWSILCLLLVVAVGVAIYWMWYQLNLQIATYRYQAESSQEQIQQLYVQIAGLQEENQLNTANLPIYVDPKGNFSIYKDIPSLKVSADEQNVRLSYGEVNGDEPVSGFVMIITVQPTNGRSLETIVNADYEHAPNGVTHVGKRSESIAEHLGFSFVAYQNNSETMYYYLQDAATSKYYAKVTYKIGAANDTEYDYYDRMAIRMMNLLQLYEWE
ncbi:hypothetical protein IJJ08_05195 [bacterium]|nr:hypothetical protein [bacterium]